MAIVHIKYFGPDPWSPANMHRRPTLRANLAALRAYDFRPLCLAVRSKLSSGPAENAVNLDIRLREIERVLSQPGDAGQRLFQSGHRTLTLAARSDPARERGAMVLSLHWAVGECSGTAINWERLLSGTGHKPDEEARRRTDPNAPTRKRTAVQIMKLNI